MITREDIQSWLDRLEGGALGGQWRSSPTSGSPETPDDAEVVVHYAPPGGHPPGAGDGAARRASRAAPSCSGSCSSTTPGSWCTAPTDSRANHVVLTDTLELENLDFSEFEASFDSITLALASHLAALAPYREG